MNEIKAMLFGLMFGDGWISHIQNEKYNHYLAGFSGDSESLKIVKNDLINIYGDIGKATLNTRNTCSEKYNISGTTSSIAVNTKIAKDFITMGMPIGKKVEQNYILPDWIKHGSKEIKAAFISGLYAAEGYTPHMQRNDKTPKAMGFNLSKRVEYFESFKVFSKEISDILNDLNIKHSYSFEDTYTCAANKKVIFIFNNSIENMITIGETLNIKYNIEKKNKLALLTAYIKYKKEILSTIQEAYDLTVIKNEKPSIISKKYNISISTISNWKQRKTGIKIPNNFITFTDFCILHNPSCSE